MKVLYFDGVCNLCNSLVDFLITRDKKQELRFAPLQGKTARERLPRELTEKMRTVVFEDEGKMHLESDASIHVIASLGGFYRIIKVSKLVPRNVRNAIYRVIAHNRYKWFGRKESCRLPTPAEKARFLD